MSSVVDQLNASKIPYCAATVLSSVTATAVASALVIVTSFCAETAPSPVPYVTTRYALVDSEVGSAKKLDVFVSVPTLNATE